MSYLIDTHCHTLASGHAYSTIDENAAWAASRGFAAMAVTDHGPKMPGSCDAIHFINYKVIPKKLHDVEILTGVELNILNPDGDVDLPDRIIKHLQIVIASLHSVCIEPGSIEENTAAVINAMKNPYIKIIGHLGDPHYRINIENVVLAARDTRTVIEVNSSSLDPRSFRYDRDEAILDILVCCQRHGVPVVAGSDAHFYTDVGHLTFAQDMIEKSGIDKSLVLNTDLNLLKQTLRIE